MKLISALYLTAVFSALLLYAAVDNALALPIPAGDLAYASAPQPVLLARTNHKSSKKASSSSSHGKQPANGTPGPESHTNPQRVNIGRPPRQGGPDAYMTKPLGKWMNAGKKQEAFLDRNTKVDGGAKIDQGLQDFDRGSAKALYGQKGNGGQSTVPETIKGMVDGNRIDNQGGNPKGQDFNIQAQTNGHKPISFAACIGHTGSGANSEDILAGLQASARECQTVHLVSPDWTPQGEAS